jgi:ATP-dependent RNA helicase DeaD
MPFGDNCLTTELSAEPITGFRSLNLIPPLLDALDRAGYVEPSPIQAALIPVALTGRDVMGQAQTGTGKTAAFLLPFMNSWRGGHPHYPQAIVLAPTRELAVQVAEEADKLAPSRHFRTVPVYGGQRFGRQMELLRKGCTLVVGTPGRVNDHLQRGTISLQKVRYVVLDEADRMLDIGFRPQIERIMRRVPTTSDRLC